MDAQNEATLFVQPHFNGRIYSNFAHEIHTGFFSRSLYMFFVGWLQKVGNKTAPLRHDATFIPDAFSQYPLRITWIGHSTFLISCGGITFLTDPIFGNASWLFPRLHPPGIKVAGLPSIDYILISHNHRDHMDAPTLKALRSHGSTILVPQGDKGWFDKRGFGSVHQATWWQTLTFEGEEGAPLHITFLPALHWSQRSLWDKNRSLWGSWMISYKGMNLYFGGDSAYWDHFKQIRKRFVRIDVALLPIGPCEPRHWLRVHHMSAQEAGQAFLDLDAHHFIPMHWGTFSFGVDTPLLPVKRLLQWWRTSAPEVLATKTLHVPALGQTLGFALDPALPAHVQQVAGVWEKQILSQ